MSFTFYKCTNLTTGSTIPSSVTNISGTYRSCPNLEGILEINANVTGKNLGEEYYNNIDYHSIFQDSVINSGKKLKLTGSCAMLPNIIEQFKNPNITL